MRLELRLSGSTLGGQISLGDIHVDTKGVVETAKAAPAASTPLLDVARKDGLLTFARKDGRDTDHFQLKVIDDNTAELTFILSDADRKEMAAQGIPGSGSDQAEEAVARAANCQSFFRNRRRHLVDAVEFAERDVVAALLQFRNNHAAASIDRQDVVARPVRNEYAGLSVWLVLRRGSPVRRQRSRETNRR